MDMHNPSHRLKISEHLVLSIFWFALNFQSAAIFAIVIPTQILLFVTPGEVGNAQQATFLGWLSAAGSVVALLVPPAVGMLSDHTTGAWGRRRPYIMLGTLLMLLSVFMLATAHDAPFFIVGFLLCTMCMLFHIFTAARFAYDAAVALAGVPASATAASYTSWPPQAA